MKCDKCGAWVPESNDLAVILGVETGINIFERRGAGEVWDDGNRIDLNEIIRRSVAASLFDARSSRHFLPVFDNDGEKVCAGSPSRAQFIEGQPRDSRGFGYPRELEGKFRKAYQKTQELYSNPS